MNTTLVIVIALVAFAAAGALIYARRRRSQRLRTHYGSEYIAAVDELGDRRRAEAELKARERRVERFKVRPLRPEEADRYAARWRQAQADFVDDPGAAVADADVLIGEVMRARGYPVSDFEQRAADLSVDHPKLVADYRIAHEVALRHARGDAGTEDLRMAMIHYRDLFDELVEPPRVRADEQRTFKEEIQDERAARARYADGRRADDRAARERGRGIEDRRAPLV